MQSHVLEWCKWLVQNSWCPRILIHKHARFQATGKIGHYHETTTCSAFLFPVKLSHANALPCCLAPFARHTLQSFSDIHASSLSSLERIIQS